MTPSENELDMDQVAEEATAMWRETAATQPSPMSQPTPTPSSSQEETSLSDQPVAASVEGQPEPQQETLQAVEEMIDPETAMTDSAMPPDFAVEPLQDTVRASADSDIPSDVDSAEQPIAAEVVTEEEQPSLGIDADIPNDELSDKLSDSLSPELSDVSMEEPVAAVTDPPSYTEVGSDVAEDVAPSTSSDPEWAQDAMLAAEDGAVANDVLSPSTELQMTSGPEAQDGPTLTVPGEIAEAGVPVDSADHPQESAEAILPVPEFQDVSNSPDIPLPNDPIADAWGPDLPMTAPSRQSEDVPGGAYRGQSQPFEIPPGLLDGIGDSLEPQLEQLRAAVQGRAAEVIEDQAVLATLASVPE